MSFKALVLSLVLAGLTGAASAQELSPEFLTLMGRVPDEEVARISAAAASHPLGSQENPIRTSGVAAQHSYLRRLRCADGNAPRYERDGNIGPGIYGSIVDAYTVACAGADETTLYLDLYHPGHVENAAPQGFTIVR